MIRFRSLAIVLFLALSSLSADAAIIASFTSNGTAFVPVTINTGQTTEIPLYLWYENTSTDPDPPDPNFLNSPGLLSAGLGVTFDTGIANVTAGSIDLAWNQDPLLSMIQFDNAIGTAGIVGGLDFFDPVVIAPDSILIGTFTFTGISGGTTTLTLGDFSAIADTVIDDGLGTALDGVIQFGSTATITVNGTAAVPEPGTGLALLLGVGYWGWRSRRRVLSVRNSREN